MSTLKTTYIQKVGIGTAAFELPAADGSAGQVLSTNGSGALSWTTADPLGSAAAVSGTSFQFNSGYGSVATAYGCRAWVNFNGISTVAIRASGNVSSITDNGTGTYTVNFTTAMPDANYCALGSIIGSLASQNGFTFSYVTTTGNPANTTVSHVEIVVVHVSQGAQDHSHVNVAVFR
jgi:hypothetical protein